MAIFRRGFRLRDFYEAVRVEENAIELAYELDLVQREMLCPVCHQMMRRQRMPSLKLGFRWRCRRVNCTGVERVDPTHNTFFDDHRLPISRILELMVHFLLRTPVCTAAPLIGVTEETAINFYSYCREVCRVAERHDIGQIGGPRDVVEVDESHLFERKYHRGRIFRRKIWVFGGISRLTRQMFAVKVVRRNRRTIFPLMQEHIALNSVIFSDKWRAYRGCARRLGFRLHASVNHSRHFVGGLVFLRNVPPRLGHPRPIFNRVAVKVHTNTLERSWRTLKEILRKTTSVDMVDNYIGYHLYRQNILRPLGKDLGIRLRRFFDDVKRVYPGPAKVGEQIQANRAICNCGNC